MVALKILAKLFKALRSNESPNQLAWGFVLGMIVGLTPLWNLHNLLVIILIIILKVNAAMAFAAFILFDIIVFAFLPVLDPLLHSVGYWLLVDAEWLRPLWLFFSRTPVLAWSNFNNTVVLGSLVVALILVIPVFFFTKWWVVQYRDKIDARVQKWKIVQILKSTKLVQLYNKIIQLGE
ncbi:TIGR03546 family protein [candidate division KSB1 bacterium]|nr:TIGR03546 family protein [candidate division KSB1 bacterium]RQW04332.1 MAG: TIGR03546 family protein [candidate division KSB1 bacterium]